MLKAVELAVILIVLAVIIVTFGCLDPLIDGRCKYVDIPGTVVVISVTDADASANNCPNDPVEVRFNFTPDDPAARDLYIYGDVTDTNRRLTVFDGKNPPRHWVVDQGLTEGSTHRCIRHEAIEGTCTPVIFDFPDLAPPVGCFAGD